MGDGVRDGFHNRQWMERMDKRWRGVEICDEKASEMKEASSLRPRQEESPLTLNSLERKP